MERTIISKRLSSVMPQRRTDVKVNGETFFAYWNLERNVYRTTDKDIEFDFIVSSEFNYFCYNKQNKITYWPTSKGEQPMGKNDTWAKEGRQEMKPGKFLLLFKDYYTIYTPTREELEYGELRDKIILRLCEIFADSLKGVNTEITFQITNEISRIYDTRESDLSGCLTSSCMRASGDYRCHDYASFYNLVPNLKIVYQTINDQLLFRALLWTAKVVSGMEEREIKFLDRIYATEAVMYQMIEHAKKEGWAWRNFGNDTVHYGEDIDGLKLVCPIPDKAYNYLAEEGSPYVDTLCYLKSGPDGWELTNDHRTNYECSLQECDGNAVHERCICECCGDSVDEDAYRDPDGCPLCQSCFYDRYDYCDHCGETYDRDDLTDTGHGNFCTDCLNRLGYMQCVECGNWYRNCITEVNGDLYCEDCYSDKFTHCEECDGDVERNDTREIIVDGERRTVCVDCILNLFECNKCGEYFRIEDEIVDGLCEYCRQNPELPFPKENEEYEVTSEEDIIAELINKITKGE